MQGGGVAVRLERTQPGAGLDLLSALDAHFAEFAVQGEILAVLHQHALVIARHDDDLADLACEDAVDVGPLGGGEGDAGVVGQLQVGVDRMVVDAEALLKHLHGSLSLRQVGEIEMIALFRASLKQIWALFATGSHRI